MKSFEEIEKSLEHEQRDIIKVKTECYVNSRNELCFRKTIRQMRSLSKTAEGYLTFEEELRQVGEDAVETSLAGIQDLQDGLYEMYVKWQSRDIETGYVDDVEFGFRKLKD